ncbi:hypothetical protein V3C99_002475, partial [Haemonchus contortus]
MNSGDALKNSTWMKPSD